MWISEFKTDIRSALRVVRIFTVKAQKQEVVAVAVCFGPGYELSDVPDSDEVKNWQSWLSAEQRQFRNEVRLLICQ